MSGARSKLLFKHDVLGKYTAEYHFDEEVGYIFARNPFWLDEAYSSAIAITDTGILQRNIRNVDIVGRSLLRNAHRLNGGIDLGGGIGLFVRGMRDAGFDFVWSDKYAINMLARGFEAGARPYDIAVAFEVLEHLENPIEFLEASRDKFCFHTCFFSATCFNEHKYPGFDWWYWGFNTGQHISFFSERTLQWMAKELGMQLWHIWDDVYAFSSLEWKPLVNGSPSGFLNRMRRTFHRICISKTSDPFPKSLTFDDHVELIKRLQQL